jgi:hypothetical protein
VVLVAMVLSPTAARADLEDHTHQPVVDGIRPAVDGITVEVRAQPAPTLVLRNTTRGTVEVLDDDGEPFLRIGPTHVEANAASPDFYRSESPSPDAAVPPSATGGERFVRIVDGGDWAWFEHRIGARPVDEDWSVPLRIGTEMLSVNGHWEPVSVPARVEVTLDPVGIDDLNVAVLPGLAPALFVDNDTGEALVVPDAHGEPFLRIGPDRTTRATPGGDDAVVAPTASYAWVDARLGFQGDPPEGRTKRRWEIPARLGDRDLVLRGATSWIPLDHDGGRRRWPWLAVPVVALALAVLVLDRRRRRKPGVSV